MKKYILFPIIAYVLVCIIAVLLPASEGYNAVGWKLFVGQIYAIPVLLLASLLAYVLYRKRMIRA